MSERVGGENITLQMKKCCSKRLSLFFSFCREYGTLFFLIKGQGSVDFEEKTIKPKFKTFVKYNKKNKTNHRVTKKRPFYHKTLPKRLTLYALHVGLPQEDVHRPPSPVLEGRPRREVSPPVPVEVAQRGHRGPQPPRGGAAEHGERLAEEPRPRVELVYGHAALLVVLF